MAPEKDRTFLDYLKKVSPGTPLRTVIDDLIKGQLGALIMFDSPEIKKHNIIEGGFRVNCRFTPQKLFELCKMDGAIIVSHDLKRILYANVLINPDSTLSSAETGTRHKAAERAAKQLKTFVIAVSERRKKVTLYFSGSRYYLKSSSELLNDVSTNLQVLEKQREIFEERISNLNILEMSELVSISDVCKTIQRAEMILKISESIKRNFTELGKEGNIMHMRYRELLRNVERIENDILRDYSTLNLKKTKTLLSNIAFDGLLDLEAIGRLIFQENIEKQVSPKGYRFLSHLPLSEKEISQIVNKFKNLDKIMKSDSSQLEEILKQRAEKIKEEIEELREQVLAGKVIC